MKNFINNLKNSIEGRYAINNLLELANNATRNAILFKLTNNAAFRNYLTNLRKYWERWRKNGNLLNENALKLQNNYRRLMALKEKKRKLRIKDQIYNQLFEKREK